MKKKVLIIEDEFIIRELLKPLILHEFKDVDVDIAEEGEEAYKLIQENYYDVLLLDISMPKGMNGDVLLEKIKKLNLESNICIMSGFSNDDHERDPAIKKIFSKPITAEAVCEGIKEFLDPPNKLIKGLS